MTVPENHKLYNLLSSYSNKFNVKSQIQFEITFPGSYPFEPPFIRIILPRFIDLTTFVTKGGSICMENITNSKSNSGYNPTMSVENLLVAIHSLMLSNDNVSLDLENGNPATWDEAIKGFIYTSKNHNWETHQILKQMIT
jgi:ubiquitin-conjugating enzyme E2 Q